MLEIRPIDTYRYLDGPKRRYSVDPDLRALEIYELSFSERGQSHRDVKQQDMSCAYTIFRP